jgi:hypothetical protein
MSLLILKKGLLALQGVMQNIARELDTSGLGVERISGVMPEKSLGAFVACESQVDKVWCNLKMLVAKSEVVLFSVKPVAGPDHLFPSKSDTS